VIDQDQSAPGWVAAYAGWPLVYIECRYRAEQLAAGVAEARPRPAGRQRHVLAYVFDITGMAHWTEVLFPASECAELVFRATAP